jgi:5-oxopent-3-ene-1,2,5-tricarboxylate decarboxylase / 2-hydroxyhepta-2,4-diene-1,7-dioate isomerase
MHHSDPHSYTLPEGTVYGVLLNFLRERALWVERSQAQPYLGEAQAPVLYIKTANTFNANGGVVALPHGVAALEVGATLGLVMGDDGQAHGLVVFNDWTVPHDSFYRPPVRFKNGDGWLGVGARCWALHDWSQVTALPLQVFINDVLVQTVAWTDLFRDAPTLLAQVSAFTAWRAGDVLLLGLDCLADGRRPLAYAGDRVRICAPHGLALEHTVVGVSA